jgi:hypothetical protein
VKACVCHVHAASLSHVRAASSCVRAMEGLGCAGNAVVTSKPLNGLKNGEVSEAMKRREKAMIDKTRRTIQLCGLWLTGAPAAPIRA